MGQVSDHSRAWRYRVSPVQFIPLIPLLCKFRGLTPQFNRIQPPNTWHEVYTPVPSVVRGGHFLSFNALHLTEVSRQFDQAFPRTFTNQDHQSAPLALARMLVVLIDDEDKGNLGKIHTVYRGGLTVD